MLEALLLSISLCADCFAVALCSGVTLESRSWKNVLEVALVFAFIHICFLSGGCVSGGLLAGVVYKISKLLGALLLFYVGGSMLWSTLHRGKDSCELHSLGTPRNIVLAAIATSIDAFAVGAASALKPDYAISQTVLLAAVLFVVTIVIVSVGLLGGSVIGRHYGYWAEIVGGVVLIGIGLWSFIF